MRSLLTVAVAVALCASAAQAVMVMYEDFESYVEGTSIHDQGTDAADAFGRTFRWHAQQNSGTLLDHGHSIVRAIGENQYLEMAGSGPTNPMDTVGTAMGMESVKITGLGTVYMRWAANDTFQNMLSTNSLERGWDYEGNAMTNPGVIDAYGWQDNMSSTGYSHMGAMFMMGGGSPFGARDGANGYLTDPDIQLPIETWMELWIQVDSANDRAKFFVCEQGGTPVQAMNPGPDGLPNTADDVEWWGMRNEGFDNDGVRNLKWIVSNWGHTDEIVNTLYVDTIGVDTAGFTLDRVGDDVDSIWGKPGDLDGDGDVDLDDFVILKTNFGVGPGGDIDGDGDTDLDDFVILKTNFGT